MALGTNTIEKERQSNVVVASTPCSSKTDNKTGLNLKSTEKCDLRKRIFKEGLKSEHLDLKQEKTELEISGILDDVLGNLSLISEWSPVLIKSPFQQTDVASKCSGKFKNGGKVREKNQITFEDSSCCTSIEGSCLSSAETPNSKQITFLVS